MAAFAVQWFLLIALCVVVVALAGALPAAAGPTDDLRMQVERMITIARSSSSRRRTRSWSGVCARKTPRNGCGS